MNDLLKEAIADAKAVRKTALANAKLALEEAFTPRLQSMISAKIQEEAEDDMDEMREDEDMDEMRDMDEMGHEMDEMREEDDDMDEMREEEDDMDELTVAVAAVDVTTHTTTLPLFHTRARWTPTVLLSPLQDWLHCNGSLTWLL